MYVARTPIFKKKQGRSYESSHRAQKTLFTALFARLREYGSSSAKLPGDPRGRVGQSRQREVLAGLAQLHGAVDLPLVRQLARGVRALLRAELVHARRPGAPRVLEPTIPQLLLAWWGYAAVAWRRYIFKDKPKGVNYDTVDAFQITPATPSTTTATIAVSLA